MTPPHEAGDPTADTRPGRIDPATGSGLRPLASDGQTFRRRLFVSHQQQLAQQALLLDMPGGARAALRVLSGVDFEEAAEAASYLRTLRDPRASRDAVIAAVSSVLRLTPAGDTPRPKAGAPKSSSDSPPPSLDAPGEDDPVEGG